jgi:hypothetical protein
VDCTVSEPLSFRGRLGRDRIAAASLVLLGAVLLLLTTHHGPGLCNDSSRLAAADSLANHGTFVIDHSYFSYTCDKIKVAGHFYSDKPPVQSLYLAGVLAAVQPLTHWTVARDLGSLYFVLALLSSGLSFLLCLLGVYRLSRLAGLEIGWSMLLAASACAATLMLPYSTVISSHAVGAPFVVWLFVLVYGERRRPGHPTAARALGMGLLAGLGAVVEPLSVAFSAPLLIAALSYAESRSRLGRARRPVAARSPHRDHPSPQRKPASAEHRSRSLPVRRLDAHQEEPERGGLGAPQPARLFRVRVPLARGLPRSRAL